jgi:hypothetical protein
MPTQQEAVDVILGAFNDAWSVNPDFPVMWPDKTAIEQANKQNKPWAVIQITHGKGRQMSLASADGKKLWLQPGQFGCEIYTLAGEGKANSYELIELVKKAFQAISISGVRFRGIQPKEVGVFSKWFVAHVLVDFEYDEII